MNPLPIVIDTNILVAALRSQQGAPYKLLMLLPKGVYQPQISIPLFLEYESVLKTPTIVPGLTRQDINDFLDYFLSQSGIHPIFFLWRPFLKDPKDDLVLEIAMESNSQIIVTFNKKDFSGTEKFGIQILTPQEFLNQRGITL